VARPKVINEEGVTIAAHVPISLARALKQIASATGTSVSQCVREAIEMYVREASVQLGLKLALGEREPVEQRAEQRKKVEQQDDPILEYRREKLRYGLARFERDLSLTERKWRKIVEELRMGYRVAPKPLPHDFLNELSNREEAFERLVRRYGDLMRSPEFSERVRDLARRLLELRREVERVQEAVRRW